MVNRESSPGLILGIRWLEDRPKRIRNRLRELPENGDRLIAFPVDELHRAAVEERRSLAINLRVLAHEELE